MELNDKKYCNTIGCEEEHSKERIANHLELSNTDVDKETKKMINEDFKPHKLGSGTSLNKKFVDLSGCADVIRRSKGNLTKNSSFQGNELASTTNVPELQFVKLSINSSDEKEIENTAVDREDQSSYMYVMGTEASDLQSIPKVLGDNNSKKWNFDRNAILSSSANTPLPKNDIKLNSRQNTESVSPQDSNESVFSTLSNRSSDIGFSSLYSNVETLNSSFSSVEASIDSTSILSEYTDTEDHRRRCNRGEIQHVNANHEYSLNVFNIGHQSHSDKGKTRVPVVLKAEAIYNNGELHVTVRDNRNRCPKDVDVKITVIHGVPKKRVNSKYAAYGGVPQFLGVFATDRDILKHRAMRPPFDTHVSPEAAERYGRIHRSK